MDIPARVSIFGIPYDVCFETMEDGEEGCISPMAQRITLRKNMTREKTEQVFDYQSECHCSKTRSLPRAVRAGLITSQNVTAPKHEPEHVDCPWGLITSQNVTAPKPLRLLPEVSHV